MKVKLGMHHVVHVNNGLVKLKVEMIGEATVEIHNGNEPLIAGDSDEIAKQLLEMEMDINKTNVRAHFFTVEK